MKFGTLPLIIVITALVIMGFTPPGTTTPPGNGQVEVIIENITYQPCEITINAGTTVNWTNMDSFEHTMVSGTRGAQTNIFRCIRRCRWAFQLHVWRTRHLWLLLKHPCWHGWHCDRRVTILNDHSILSPKLHVGFPWKRIWRYDLSKHK